MGGEPTKSPARFCTKVGKRKNLEFRKALEIEDKKVKRLGPFAFPKQAHDLVIGLLLIDMSLGWRFKTKQQIVNTTLFWRVLQPNHTFFDDHCQSSCLMQHSSCTQQLSSISLALPCWFSQLLLSHPWGLLPKFKGILRFGFVGQDIALVVADGHFDDYHTSVLDGYYLCLEGRR